MPTIIYYPPGFAIYPRDSLKWRLYTPRFSAIIRSMTTREETKLICTLTSGTVEQMKTSAQLAAEKGADMVEFRIDHLETPPGKKQVEEMIRGCPVPAIVTYRPVREGGRYKASEQDRLEVLKHASGCGAITDIEANVPREDRPPGTVIRSRHFFSGVPEDLEKIMQKLEDSDADIVKIAFAADNPADAMSALGLLSSCSKPAISLAMGEAGVASRILAPGFGAWGTYASLEKGEEAAPGQPSLEEFHSLYRYKKIGADTMFFGVIGSPVGHSMSPTVHNAAFEETGFDGIYVPLSVKPGRVNFERFIDSISTLMPARWRGLSITIPHKENAMELLGPENCDELSKKTGAVNTMTIEPDGTMRGYNTDYMAVIDPLTAALKTETGELAGRKVAVIGAGGAARAAVAAMTCHGAETVIYNRTLSRAESLAEEFGCSAEPIGNAVNTEAEIIINCTSLGMYPEVETTPLPQIPRSAKVVFDTVYNPPETRLLRDASSAGLLTVSGVEMFVNQAVSQYRLWTNTEPPADSIRQTVLSKLSAGKNS